jgi:steroid delta-isomerase-like uncharacterized protein
MSSEENKAIYNRYIEECFNQGRVELLDELLAPDYTYHNAPPGTPPGAAGIRQVIQMFHTAFPDLAITIEAQAAEGEMVFSRSVTRGTHNGPLMGQPASGRRVEMNGMTQVRVRDGRITDSWVNNDVAGLLRQIGATG